MTQDESGPAAAMTTQPSPPSSLSTRLSSLPGWGAHAQCWRPPGRVSRNFPPGKGGRREFQNRYFRVRILSAASAKRWSLGCVASVALLLLIVIVSVEAQSAATTEGKSLCSKFSTLPETNYSSITWNMQIRDKRRKTGCVYAAPASRPK